MISIAVIDEINNLLDLLNVIVISHDNISDKGQCVRCLLNYVMPALEEIKDEIESSIRTR